MRHHTLVHEVERDPAPVSPEGKDSSPRQAVEPLVEYRQSAYVGCETGGRALVEVLPIVVFGETGKQQVIALRDSGCDTTLIDERLALSLGLQGKEIDLEIQGVNVQKVFTSQHIKKCHVARVGKEEVKYSLRDVKTIPNLNGPDQKLKWSTIKQEYQHLKNLDLRVSGTGPVQLIYLERTTLT